MKSQPPDPETVRRIVDEMNERMAKQLNDQIWAMPDSDKPVSWSEIRLHNEMLGGGLTTHSYVDAAGVRHPSPEPRPSIQLDRLLSSEFIYEDTLDAEFLYVR